MSEQDWQNCSDPRQMLDFLLRGKPISREPIILVPRLKPKISERKFRLFVVACCYRVWNMLEDDLSKRAVVVLERYVDGLSTELELREAMARAPAKPSSWMEPAWRESAIDSANMLRDIYNSHPPVLAAAFLKWRDELIVKLARNIYDNKSFDQMPILADALEESGCSDSTLLAHLRSSAPHIRGCWALDAILDKT